MGYDCTLHVVDEKKIKTSLIKALLTGERLVKSPGESVIVTNDHWDVVLKSLVEDSSEIACSSLCQLALLFASQSQPYHYERGFSLCLWPDQPEGLDAVFPPELTDSPEILFEELVKKYPKLKGQFPIEFSGNWSIGTFISSRKIPKALKWVEKKVGDYDEGDQELFRGLLLVLRHCAQHKLAYWEGTDLGLPMATMSAEGSEKRRADRSFKWPDYGYEPLAQKGNLLICTYKLGPSKKARTGVADFSSWPPKIDWLNEYAIRAVFSKTGSLVTVATDPDLVFYTIRLRKKPSSDAQVQQLSGNPKVLGKNGYDWAGLFHEQVVGLMKFEKGKAPKRYPQFQNGSELFDDKTFSPAKDDHSDYFNYDHSIAGIATTGDDSEVFIWRGAGYEKLRGRLEKTFSLAPNNGYDDWTSAPAGYDGFYYLANRCLHEVHRKNPTIPHLPKLTNIMSVRQGPQSALLLKEGDNKSGDWGKIYWPETREIIALKPKLLPDVPKSDVLSLFWIEEIQRLLVFTAEEVWFIPWEELQNLPRSKVRS